MFAVGTETKSYTTFTRDISEYSRELPTTWSGDCGVTELNRMRARREGCEYLVGDTALGDVFAISRGKELIIGAGQVSFAFCSRYAPKCLLPKTLFFSISHDVASHWRLLSTV
jgi:hypothetical protein